MRVPVSWLRTLLPDLTADAGEIGAALLRVGFEVEHVHRVGDDVRGVVVGKVLDIEELTGLKKPIRYCHVDIGSRVHEVICGATNFAVDDLVAFATPGGLLPGDFHITSRKTYGHISDGMICSARELGLSDEHSGILVLPPDSPLGADVVELLALRDEVLDIAVTPDRGYALSMRGIAREVAAVFGLDFQDPATLDVPPATGGHPVRIDDLDGCDRYVARTVTGLDPAAPSPAWLQRRLTLAGMRPISLAVDVTNHVLLELGQPLHAFDRDKLAGSVVVRRAKPGERLATLDGQDRALDPEDLVIADDTGPIALAGVMGGAATEVDDATTSLLIESAHFLPVPIARAARRHKLPSEASKRFERGVDPELAPVAAQAAVDLLVRLGGAMAGGGTDEDEHPPAPVLRLPLDLPSRLAGRHYDPAVVRRRLADVGCAVDGDDVLQVVPPSWRPDLIGSADLVEEVWRLEGYDSIPVQLPTAPAGRGLTDGQRLRRTASRALAATGLLEVVLPPFVSEESLDALGGGMTPPRLLNPLAETEALLRPSLLPGLLAAVHRNLARGLTDVALFETGVVFPTAGSRATVAPGVTGRPTDDELAALDASLPAQPRHAALALAGRRHGRAVDWADAIEAVLAVGRALGLTLDVQRLAWGPFHPGRCAELLLDGRRVGLAGELHPRVTARLSLPARTVAGECNLDMLIAVAESAGPVDAPVISAYPPASVDVALVVDETVPAADVETALRAGAGDLLEEIRLFDVYVGPQVGEGRRSLAFALRMRATDRTLTDAEVLGVRDDAIAEAGRRVGAELRG
ncbi:MAG: phenylalanyl-tRNA synthetase beta chain [Actinomycetota bacterium]|nr:phenylalanyl-tRNA synthetase beta chain [Actinomycetota bacterium]